MIKIEKNLLRIYEQRFTNTPPPSEIPDGDLVYYLQAPSPVGRWEESKTVLLDLSQSEELLLAEMNDTTRYEIRRASSKDQLSYQYWKNPGEEELVRFCQFFERFADLKGIERVSLSLLRTYTRAGVLDLSLTKNATQELCWHSHMVTEVRARLLHSASTRISGGDNNLRNLVGRANRFHHWEDLKRFKSSGLTQYDLGGWYPGKTDKEKLQINQFKEKFGGKIETTFNCEVPLTLKGKIYSTLKRLRRHLS